MTKGDVENYVAKAKEYLAAAETELSEDRGIAATSLAIHAGINAADAVCGARLGKRAAGQDHKQAQNLLKQASDDGTDVARHLGRLLSLKTRAEYDPDDVPIAEASKAVERARRCVEIARRVSASLR